MRRRNQLQVNTFPFLAVLLCAMGSLILILLVMDRRARIAAAQRGQDEVAQAVRERAEAIAARERDHSLKQGEVKTAYDRKKAELKARLDAEQRALDGDMRQVQARLAEIARELRSEEALVGKLRTNVRTEQVRLTRHEQALETARKEAADLGGKLTNGDRARHKLAADMVQLEQIVRDLQAARKSDAMTYSVVPYKGKHGEKRRPLYLECSASGVVFHPDKLTLADPPVSSITEEISRRAAQLADKRKKAGLKEERAYLMMLVRPNGIKRYYQVQSAIHDLPVEFGYEFVDEDWALTFPEGDLAEAIPDLDGPGAAKETVRLAAPGGSGVMVEGGTGASGGGLVNGSGTLSGAGGVALGGLPGGSATGGTAIGGSAIGGSAMGGTVAGGTAIGGSAIGGMVPGGMAPGGTATSIVGVPSGGIGIPGGQLGGGPATGIDSAPAIGGTARGNATSGAPAAGAGTGGEAGAQLSRPKLYSEGPDLDLGLPAGAGAKGSASPGKPLPPVGTTNPSGETPLVRLPVALPGSVADRAAQGKATSDANPSTQGTPTPGADRVVQGTETPAGNAPRKRNGPAFQGPDLGPAKPRAFPLLPARVGGGDDTVVFIECLSDGVVVYPSGTSYSIDSLNHSPAHNPFYQAVVAKLAKHTGDPKNRTVRFLIHRDGERTFHLAYPVFNGLTVTKTRYSLQSDDDVSRIVAGE